MGEITPFGKGASRKQFYTEVRKLEDMLRTKYRVKLSRKQARNKVLTGFASKLGFKTNNSLKKNLFGFIGITDLMLPKESIEYGVKMASQVKPDVPKANKVAIALWTSRLHNSATSVYQKPDLLKKFEDDFGKMKHSNFKEMHHDLAATRAQMFSRVFSGITPQMKAQMHFNRYFSEIKRNIFPYALHPDHIHTAEQHIAEIVRRVNPALPVLAETEEAGNRLTAFHADQAFMEKYAKYSEILKKFRELKEKRKQIEDANPELYWINPDEYA